MAAHYPWRDALLLHCSAKRDTILPKLVRYFSGLEELALVVFASSSFHTDVV
ncbi:MAG: hypothetical protein LBJ41_03755 [Treponema sp.]|jgi:hypothetical protein|nr:hypothetical protein [Treponema sp.]